MKKHKEKISDRESILNIIAILSIIFIVILLCMTYYNSQKIEINCTSGDIEGNLFLNFTHLNQSVFQINKIDNFSCFSKVPIGFLNER